MRLAMAALVLIAVGCDSEKAKREKAYKEALASWGDNVGKKEQADQAKVDAIKKDRKGMATKAVEQMRKAAAENYGKKAADEARITADEASIKDLGDGRFEVAGTYEGRDRSGREFKAPFTATVGILVDRLILTDLKIKEKVFKDGKP
jgi:hypothetical protein